MIHYLKKLGYTFTNKLRTDKSNYILVSWDYTFDTGDGGWDTGECDMGEYPNIKIAVEHTLRNHLYECSYTKIEDYLCDYKPIDSLVAQVFATELNSQKLRGQ